MDLDFFNLARDNLLYAMGVSFAGGVLTSFTPCVYPVIMITVGIFGARKASSRIKAFLLSSTFALAIIIMYTTLGMISALSGNLFGNLYQNKFFILFISSIFFLMSLSLFGAFTISLPASLQTKLASTGKAGFAGAFIMGIVSGILAAPCAGPVLIGILTFVSATADVITGICLLFSYSLGMSLIFVVVGTTVMSLPKSGNWLNAVKDVLASGMMIMAFYFLLPLLPSAKKISFFPYGIYLLVSISLTGVILLIVVDTVVYNRMKVWNDDKSSKRKKLIFYVLKFLSILVFLTGGICAIYSHKNSPATGGDIEWIINNEAHAFSLARTKKLPVLIDFTAKWCEACIKIDRETFSNPRVKEQMEHFVKLRIDLTEADEKSEAIRKKYLVSGLPAVILVDSEGKEKARINRFIEPAEFLRIIKNIK